MTLSHELKIGMCAILGAAWMLAACDGSENDGGAAGDAGGLVESGGVGGDTGVGGGGGIATTDVTSGAAGTISTSAPGGQGGMVTGSTGRTGGTTGASTGTGAGGLTGTAGKAGSTGGSTGTGGLTGTAGKAGSTGGSTSTGGTTGTAVSTGTGGTGGSASGPAAVALREGRFDVTDAARPQFGWSGAALVARFQGTGAVARIDGSPNQFTVVIDGTVSSTILKVVSGTSQYTVASGLPAGTHDIVIARRTEGNQGPSRFSGLDITGGQLLAPPAAPDRRIEVYGDSISAGYGLDGKGPSCPFSADTENHYLTYAAIAARTLKAELHNNAWSGIGMYRNYGQAGPSSDAMPAVYARTIPDRNKSDWDFASWQPHVVIINLGTNDISSNGDPGQPYRKAYLEFVRTLHQKHPEAFFILSIGPMLDSSQLSQINAHLQSVIDTMAGEGFAKMSRITYPTQVESDGLGCDWHPGPATNAKMATQLVTELKAKLNW